MSNQNTDLTFFTNDQDHTLLDRFKATLADTRLFDVLVGYFRSSGFYQLYDSIAPVEKTRILVGLGVDDESYRAIDAYRAQALLDFESHKSAKATFQENLISEIEGSEESDDKLELGLSFFKRIVPIQKTIANWVVVERNLKYAPSPPETFTPKSISDVLPPMIGTMGLWSPGRAISPIPA